MVCDNHFVVMLGAFLKSVEENHVTKEFIRCYLVSDGISKKNKLKIEKSLNPEIISIVWIPMKEAIPADVILPTDTTSYPLSIYARLFISNYLPDKYEKVIYFDVDMIIKADLSELWDIKLDDYTAAAVKDPRLKVFSNRWGGIFNYKELGFAPDTEYFNSGLIIINTRRYKEFNIARKVIKCIHDNRKYANYPDQYGLNIVLANQWLSIDSEWNAFADTTYSQPKLIHFVGRKPIYKSYHYIDEYRNIFYLYLNKTSWQDFKPIGESRRYMKKVNNYLKKAPFLIKYMLKKQV